MFSVPSLWGASYICAFACQGKSRSKSGNSLPRSLVSKALCESYHSWRASSYLSFACWWKNYRYRIAKFLTEACQSKRGVQLLSAIGYVMPHSTADTLFRYSERNSFNTICLGIIAEMLRATCKNSPPRSIIWKRMASHWVFRSSTEFSPLVKYKLNYCCPLKITKRQIHFPL